MAAPKRFTALAMASVLAAGCTLEPDYHRPAAPVAGTYTAPADMTRGSTQQVGVPAAALGWGDFFKDERLKALVRLALANNRDLRTAVLDVAQAEAQFRLQRGELFPQISLSGSGFFEGLPQSGVIGSPSVGSTSTGGIAGDTGTGASTTSASAATTATGIAGSNGTLRYYSAGIGFSSYELDVFGRIRSLTRQAFERYLAQAENRRSVQITLVSQVANAYLTWCSDRALLDVTLDTLKSQEDSFRLTKAQFDAGTATLLTLRQAETQLEQARANLAQYRRQVAQDENALALVVGAPLPADLPPPRKLGEQVLQADLPAGLPSDLLVQRPDIANAEHTLLSANAEIGAARAAFFPRIILTAQDGVQSLQLSKLFTAGATTWSFSPQISVPIFTAGENQANLDLAKIEKNLDVAAYEKAIQTAFREVSDALVARGTYLEQTRQQQALVDSNADAYRIAMMRFRAGVDAYLVTLDSQRSLYSAQQTLIAVQLAQLQNLVTIYRALGGGFTETTVVPPTNVPPNVPPGAKTP